MWNSAVVLLLKHLKWKKSIFFTNLQLARGPWLAPDYECTLTRMVTDLGNFLFARRQFFSTPLQLEKYPFQTTKTCFHIDPSTKSFIEDIRVSGGLLLTAHYGNYECMGLWLMQLGIPLAASFQPQKPKPFNQLLLSLRTVNGKCYAQLPGIQNAILAVQRRQLFALLLDQDYRSKNAVGSFFAGRKVNCNPLPATLLKKFPELPVYCAAMLPAKGSYALQIIKINSTHADELYSQYHLWLERLMQSDPNLWYGWFHRRFHSTINSQ